MIKYQYSIDQKTLQELAHLIRIKEKCKWFWQRWAINNTIVAKLEFRMAAMMLDEHGNRSIFDDVDE